MSKEKIYIFDTTLRDGAQTEGVDFSIEDKNKIALVLSDLGVDYIEGGWPGANPVDTKFFSNPPKMSKTLFTAFGMTKKTGRSADNDPGLASLINANTPAVCVVGKSWDFHVKVALGIKNDENLENIRETTKHFIKNKKEFLFDAEHFFDGFKSNPDFALNCLKQAYDNGARWVVLCDTNGGTLPNEVREIVSKVVKVIPGKNLGIHAHNDTENAVANSLAAVECGVRQIQGTINGLGERCGNANLTSIEKIVRPIGYYHQKSLRLKNASDLIISKFEGHIPKKYSDLIQIPGIGDKCAKKYLSLINKAHYIIIDAHLIRVLTRLDLISSDFSHTQIENFIKSNLKNTNYTDFSNLLNLFGKRLCKSRKPQCIKCPFKNFCNFIN